jgi:DNA-binding CsgD family transcriptional regulator/catechol 2,3-dioxygenase-like lactoylglutathione lyase family enzyme
LTPAEWRTVHALQHGLTNREIARRRGISCDAVKYHVANALAKLGLQNRQALRHWFRAPAGSALSKRTQTMSTSQLGPLAQISRSVRDIKESEAWYANTLGLPHLYTYGTLAFFDCGGTRFTCSRRRNRDRSRSSTCGSRDIRAADEALRSRGVAFDSAPHMIHRHADGTEEWLATFRDPEGRPLMIMAQVRP